MTGPKTGVGENFRGGIVFEMVGEPADGRVDKSILCTLYVPERWLGEEEADAGEGHPEEEERDSTLMELLCPASTSSEELSVPVFCTVMFWGRSRETVNVG